MWEQIHPEIVQASQEIAKAGKYDDAIFAAFRVIEAKVQERVGSQSIGQPLITEAFDGNPPQVHISSDPRNRRGIQELFSGALSHIRNDRGHKKAPLTPCESLHDCVLYLGFASFLLYLLAKDRNIFPRIEGVRLLGTAEEPRAELRGINFGGSQVSVAAEDAQASVVRQAHTVLEVLLPRQFYGNLRVLVDGKPSGEVFCDVSFLGKQPENYYEVTAADLPLYSDAKAVKKRLDVVGLLLRVSEGPHEFVRIVPTYRNRYRAGSYVTHGPYEHGINIGETWYTDPATGVVEYAWTSSVVAVPNVVGVVNTLKFGGISIVPKSVQTQVGENRCFRVLGWGRDGPVQKELDVTDRVKWKSINSSIAFVRQGIIIPKSLGKTRFECELEGFVASADVSVEHIPRGERTVYFQGLRGLQQIRFDRDDSLYICNQGPSVFRLDKTGSFEEVLRISTSPQVPYYVDCLAVDAKKNLYISDISRRAAFRFEWDGHGYVNPIEIGRTVAGPKKGIAVTDSGDVFVAVMGPPGQGWIVRQKLNGEELSFPSHGMPISLAAGPGGNIYVLTAGGSSILLYRPDGTVTGEIPHQAKDSAWSDILVGKGGVIYLAGFHTGRILRISGTEPDWHVETLPHHFGTPGGIAMDSRERLYVSDFAGNSIHVVY